MKLFIDGAPADIAQYAPAAHTHSILLIPADKIEDATDSLPLGQLFSGSSTHPSHDKSSRFESHGGMDCISLSIPDPKEIEKPLTHILIYLTSSQLVFIYDSHPSIHAFIQVLNSQHSQPMPLERALYTFLNLLTEKDSAFLQDMEEKIASLEDSLTENNTSINYTREISRLRKKLLQWKRFYESLFDLLVDLEENENHLFSKQQLHYFRLLTNRADRLSRSVLNLRDYVTQVRESYQAQMDISLNQIMKLFTVLSAIFMPLTLIVGWYGMNLAMPEYGLPHAYPFVIGASIIIVLGCLAYFKNKKWF